MLQGSRFSFPSKKTQCTSVTWRLRLDLMSPWWSSKKEASSLHCPRPTPTHCTHAHILSSSQEPDESFLQLEYLAGPFISPSATGRQRWESDRSYGPETHQSRSSHRWHRWGNWGCQSASPAALLCSSCSSLTGPSQNRQRTTPPETSGWKHIRKSGLGWSNVSSCVENQRSNKQISVHRSVKRGRLESGAEFCIIIWEKPGV